jgi:hypothetical protein
MFVPAGSRSMNDVIKTGPSTVAIVATLVLLACVVGGVGFVLGRDSAEPVQAQSVDLPTVGTRSVGTSARPSHIAAARKAAYERGYAAGRRAAVDPALEGRDHGGRANDQDVLSTKGTDLEPGSYYIVKVVRGDSGKVRIGDYAPMRANRAYGLCDKYDVCQGSRRLGR